jgi:hypothetical protein
MESIGAISSAVMALVWIVYFQVFFLQYRRNNRPYLVIHHAQNENPDALCLLVNMSKEPVHIQCVQAVTFANAAIKRTLTVTEYQRVDPGHRDLERVLRQGPLLPGGYLVLGSYRDIILGRSSEDDAGYRPLEEIDEVELRAAFIYGPMRSPVGVRRRFILRHQHGTQIFPRNIHSEQLLGRKRRAEVREWVESELNPQRIGDGETEHSDQSE